MGVKDEVGVLWYWVSCGTVMDQFESTLVRFCMILQAKSSVGFLKGKSAIQIARNFQGRKQNFTGQHFWSRGYYVSTVGKDENIVREYIRNQEREDKRLDQLNLFG